MSLLAELKRRKVFKVGAAYLVVAWLAVQAASIVLPTFAAPLWALRVFILFALLGFPLALVLAWAVEATPDGLRADSGAAGTKRVVAGAVALVLLALGWYFYGQPSFRAGDVAAASAATAASAGVNTAPTATVAGDTSIAVLPFVDMSQGKDQEYFSDGLSEELLNQLAQIPQLRVIARTSSFSFKGKEVDVADIARILKVGHVLEGSVRKSGDTLRITAQLIRASDSSHLWSNTYDRKLDDVFKVQDEISREVVEALKLKLLPGKQPDNTQHTHNTAAYEQYLLGKDLARVGGRGAVEAGLAAFQRAVALDPGYANAWAQLGTQQASLADFADGPAQRESTITASLASADKAIALAPDLPEGYAARSNTRYRLRWDWQGAQADLARAIELDPNRSGTLLNGGPILFSFGRRDEGLQMLRKAVVADPLSENAWTALGRITEAAGNVAEAKAAYTRALEINPQQNWANFLLGSLLLRAGDVDGAIAHFQRAPEQFRITGMAMAEFSRGNDAASRAHLTTLEKDFAVGFAFQIAQVHAWRGEKDQAFDWLARCFPLYDAGLVRLPFDLALDPLRKDPRFDALVAKLGLPK